jgi:hypothetical protein
MHAMLERVSWIFQRDDLSIGDVGAEVNLAIEETRTARLSTACGKLESQVPVHNFVKSRLRQELWAENTGSFAITCDADDSDVLAHTALADRLYLCRHPAGALFERLKSGLSSGPCRDGTQALCVEPQVLAICSS